MRKILKNFAARYLRLLTRSVLIRFEPDVIAVAGSLGKTRTKDYIKRILSAVYYVRANPRSYNTEIGLPLAVLNLESGGSSFLRWLAILSRGTLSVLGEEEYPSKLVLELGTDRPGDMDYLMSIVRPRVLVVTNIRGGFLGHFEDLEQMQEEIEKAVRRLKKDDLLILNADDPWTIHMRRHAKCSVVTFGLSAGHFMAKALKRSGSRQKVEIIYKSRGARYKKEFIISGSSEEHIYGLLAACAVGAHYGVGLSEASKILSIR